MQIRAGVALLGCLLLCSCQAQKHPDSVADKSLPVISMTSSAFVQGGPLPPKYTCEGDKISPPLQWGPVPKGTQVLALICDDPDAPGGTFAHWVLFNLPASSRSLPERAPTSPRLTSGAKQGQNDFGGFGYGAPCPPSGIHRYIFKLYALDQPLALDEHTTRESLLKAMETHISARGEITAIYGKGK